MVDTNGDTAAYVPVTSAITAATPSTLAGGWNNTTSPSSGVWERVVYGDGKFVASASDGTNRIMYSYDGISWTNASTPNADSADKWYALIYADGLFVAISGADTINSTDGINWSSPAPHGLPASGWQAMAYGNGTFVCVGSGSYKLMHSSNGINWSLGSYEGGALYLTSVTYGNGMFVAVSSNTTYGFSSLYSYDGKAWTSSFLPTRSQWQSITFGNGMFVAVSGLGLAQAYSFNGIDWTTASTQVAGAWKGVTYADGKFVAVSGFGYDNASMYSTDGINWIAQSSGTAYDWRAVTYGGGKFVAVSGSPDPQVMWSYTGTDDDENRTTLALTPTSKDLKYFNPGDKVTQGSNVGTVTRVGPNELVLKDTTLAGGWTSAGMASYPWRCITYGEGKFVAVAYDTSYSSIVNRIAYSSDGITWKYSNVAAAVIWQGVAYGGGKFVSVGYSYGAPNIYDHIMYSDDGITWAMSAVNSIPSNGFLYSVIYGADKFVAVGVDKFMYSTDAINWTTATAPTTVDQSWTSVTYGNGKFVAVSSTSATINRVMYSPDGINWTQAAAAAQLSWQAVTYGNGMFVAIANSGSNYVMYSSDGINWTSSSVEDEPNPERKTWSTVAYGNGKFVALTSSQNLTMHSTDGITWSAITNSGSSDNTAGWAGLAYGGNKFAAVASSGTNLAMYSYTGTMDDEVSDWTTSVGQAAELDKSLSGAGTYDSHTGSVMTVNNSNTEWVDNDNQRGDDYYATTGTTRLSLAKALTIDDYGVMTANARQWAATAIAGYYPLFRFERIAKLVGDGTAHSHIFDGVTWYMPNGVTYYHGDYSG
jgi:hypothetical protein